MCTFTLLYIIVVRKPSNVAHFVENNKIKRPVERTMAPRMRRVQTLVFHMGSSDRIGWDRIGWDGTDSKTLL